MGGDGGSLNNTRREHTRLRSSVLSSTHKSTTSNKISRMDTAYDALNLCAITKTPLDVNHAVGDRLGHLMNKEAVIEMLLARKRGDGKGGDKFAHIEGLKDVVVVKLKRGRDGVGWVCPVGGREAGRGGVWLMGWKCGCCGERAAGLKVAGGEKGGCCLFCGEKVVEMVELGIGGEKKRLKLEVVMEEKEVKRKNRRRKRKRDDGLVKSQGEVMGESVREKKLAKVEEGNDVYQSLFLGDEKRKKENFTGVA